MDKQNLYSIFFLLAILFLVLFFSRFSILEGLEETPPITQVENANTSPPPVNTITPVIQATSSPTVTTDPIPTSNTNNLASLIETPTISTAKIVKISDIQAQVTNLRTILQKDVVIHATNAVQLIQNNQELKKPLSMILNKPVRREIELLIRNMENVHMNLYLQTMQIKDNLDLFTTQYQNL